MYKDWLKALEDFKASSRHNTYESEELGILIRPGDGTKGTVEIRENANRIYLTENQARFLVAGLKVAFGID